MKRKEILDTLTERYPSARIAYHTSKVSRWVYATFGARDLTLEYNHRDVLPNEVVFDLDAPTEEENFETLRLLSKKLLENKILFSAWQTGGPSGYHVHTFWDFGNASEELLLKECIFEWVTSGVTGKFDRQLLGKHLVRMEWGYYEKTYPQDKYKMPVLSDDHMKLNAVPEEVWSTYEQKVLRYALRRMKPQTGVPQTSGTRPCMKFILSPAFKEKHDGGKRALFAVASYFRSLPDDELFTLLHQFNNYNLKEKLSEYELRKTVESVRKHQGRPVGCRYRHALLKEIGYGEEADGCE